MQCGVYEIVNTINGDCYIGSSKNIKNRWFKHKALLRHNKHDNHKLQDAWNYYSEVGFKFNVILECPEEELKSRENYYITLRHPKYNISQSAFSSVESSETKAKISKSVQALYDSNKFPKVTKPVYQYDLEGNYIREYSSVTAAAEGNISILNHISSCANGHRNIANGYVWRFYKVDKLDVRFNRNGKPKKDKVIHQKRKQIAVDLGAEIKIFNTSAEVCSFLNCTIHQFYKAVNINRLINKKFKVYYV